MDGQQPRTDLASAVLRTTAFVLTFVGGACAMYGWQSWAGAKPDLDIVRNSAEPSAPAVPAPVGPVRSNDAAKVAIADKRTEAQTPPVAEIPSNVIRVPGITEPAPGRFARLPLATSQAIAFVDVKVGDRIKKGLQVFSHRESPDRLEAIKTESEKAKKLLEIVKVRHENAQQAVARLNKLKGSASAQELEDAKSNVKIREQEVLAAELVVTEAERRFAGTEFEFSQAFVTSPIDGIVAAVDVSLGERRQVGGAFRGVTILDARVLHCRCMLSQEQLNRLAQSSNVSTPGEKGNVDKINADEGNAKSALAQRVKAVVVMDGREWPAKMASTGLIADPNTGLVPVVLEVQNSDEDLRVGSRVTVSFQL